IEIWPAGFPVFGIPRQLDRFVRLEFDEFERAGTDRMLAHVARRHVARIDRREPGSEQGDECRLWALQPECHLVIAVGGDLIEVAIPSLARVDPKRLTRLALQQVPGALDVAGRKRLAVMPFDTAAPAASAWRKSGSLSPEASTVSTC